jgi:cytoskeletal protein CcmA (bactofilin family)
MKTMNFTSENKEKERLNANSCSIISGGGERTITGDLIVSGKYSGRLMVNGMITLDSNASVTGEIIANEMVIEGKFNGIARVGQKIVFGKTASFSGTLHAAEAEFHKGCTITGRRSVGISHEKESTQDIPRNYGSVNESIIFSGNDDRVYMVL